MTVLTPAQVCEELGIQDSTLRKYSLLLDKEGIFFERHKNNRRKYTETHVVTLKRTLELMHNDDITLEKAIHVACSELKAHPIIDGITVIENPLQRNNSDVTELLVEEVRGLKVQLSEQEERQKERDTLFVEALEDLQKEIRELKSLQQSQIDDVVSNHPIEEKDVISTDIPKKKKGFLAWLFK